MEKNIAKLVDTSIECLSKITNIDLGFIKSSMFIDGDKPFSKEQFKKLLIDDRLKYIKDKNLLSNILNNHLNDDDNISFLKNNDLFKNLINIKNIFLILNNDVVEKLKENGLNINSADYSIENQKELINEEDKGNDIILNINKFLNFFRGFFEDIKKERENICEQKNTIESLIYNNENLKNLEEINNFLLNDNLTIEDVLKKLDKKNIDEIEITDLENIIELNLETGNNKLDKDIISEDIDTFDFTKKSTSEIKHILENLLNNEKFDEFRVKSIIFSKNNNILDILKNLKFKKNFYGKIQEIEVLNTIILLKKDSYNEYKKLFNLIKDLSNTKPNNIDCYLTRAKLFSNIVKSGNFNNEILEKISEESILTMEECIKKYYSLTKCNSVSEEVKKVYSNILINHANFLDKKYSLNKKLSLFKIDLNLNLEEIKYIETLKKAYEFSAENVEKVKSCVVPLLNTSLKVFSGFYLTKNLNKSIDKSWFKPISNALFSIFTARQISNLKDITLFNTNPNEYHNDSFNKEYGNFKRFFSSIKLFFKKTLYFPIRNFLNKRRIKKNEKVLGINGYFNKHKNLDFIKFKKNMLHNNIKIVEEVINKQNIKINESIIEEYRENGENKFIKIIDSFMNLKYEALNLKYKKDLIKIYENFKEFNFIQGDRYSIFKNSNIKFHDVIKGVTFSIIDTSTFGFSSKFYNNYLRDKKVSNKEISRYRDFIDSINSLNNVFIDRMNNLRSEHAKRFIGLNSNIININKNLDIDDFNLDFGYYDFFDKLLINNIEFKEDLKIFRKINRKNYLLSSVNNFKLKNINKTYNDIVNLLINNSISDDIKSRNLEKFIYNINYFSEKGKINISEYKDMINNLLFSSNTFLKNKNLFENERILNITKNFNVDYIKKIDNLYSNQNRSGPLVSL